MSSDEGQKGINSVQKDLSCCPSGSRQFISAGIFQLTSRLHFSGLGLDLQIIFNPWYSWTMTVCDTYNKNIFIWALLFIAQHVLLGKIPYIKIGMSKQKRYKISEICKRQAAKQK